MAGISMENIGQMAMERAQQMMAKIAKLRQQRDELREAVEKLPEITRYRVLPQTMGRLIEVIHYKGQSEVPGEIGLVVNVVASKPCIIAIYEVKEVSDAPNP